MKRIVRIFKILMISFIGLLTLLILTVAIFFIAQPKTSGPISKYSLCRDLGWDPSKQKLCNSEESYIELLEATFPLDYTKRNEVRSVLQPYFLSSDPATIFAKNEGIVDSYAMQRTLISPNIGVFIYDNDDVLVEIRFYD